MTEKELIEKLLALKEIKPNADWVVLTKNQILEKEFILEQKVEQKKSPFPFFFPIFRPVFASLVILLVIFGLFGFAQNSLPGDFLYPLKRISEKSQAIFVSEKELPTVQLDLANKRLEELNKIAENNQVRKIAPAISEFQSDIAQAGKNLAKLKNIDKKIVEKTAKLVENKEKIEKVLGANIDTSEYENFLKGVVESQISDLEKRTLTEEQKEILEKIKIDFEKENYSQALEGILILSQNSK